MGVFIYMDDSEFLWKICSDNDDVLHVSDAGFGNAFDALQNMLINHVMIGVFVSALARGEPVPTLPSRPNNDGVTFEKSDDNKIAWKIITDDVTVGHSSVWYDSIFDAVDDLAIIYTMLSVHVAELAQSRSRNIGVD